jgi:hypothetical protein
VPDLSRRAALLARSQALRVKAEAYVAHLNDRQAKEFITGFVIYRLDAIEEFWLADRATWPEYETIWLHNTETLLGLAERNFEHYEQFFAKFGSNQQIIGASDFLKRGES